MNKRGDQGGGKALSRSLLFLGDSTIYGTNNLDIVEIHYDDYEL